MLNVKYITCYNTPSKQKSVSPSAHISCKRTSCLVDQQILMKLFTAISEPRIFHEGSNADRQKSNVKFLLKK